MSKHGEQILQKALSLSPEERVELIEKLAASLDSASREKIDQLWADEAEDRLTAYDEGKIKAVPAKEVFGNKQS